MEYAEGQRARINALARRRARLERWAREARPDPEACDSCRSAAITCYSAGDPPCNRCIFLGEEATCNIVPSPGTLLPQPDADRPLNATQLGEQCESVNKQYVSAKKRGAPTCMTRIEDTIKVTVGARRAIIGFFPRPNGMAEDYYFRKSVLEKHSRDLADQSQILPQATATHRYELSLPDDEPLIVSLFLQFMTHSRYLKRKETQGIEHVNSMPWVVGEAVHEEHIIPSALAWFFGVRYGAFKFANHAMEHLHEQLSKTYGITPKLMAWVYRGLGPYQHLRWFLFDRVAARLKLPEMRFSADEEFLWRSFLENTTEFTTDLERVKADPVSIQFRPGYRMPLRPGVPTSLPLTYYLIPEDWFS